MKVFKSELVISAVRPNQYPAGALPEFALCGRSNVGKSSLINALINRKNLAHTSQRPGKTRTLNFYLINDSFYFVDVPGYGYARVSRKERQKWGEMVETYLATRQSLKAAILIVDSRHQPTEDDRLMYDWLLYYERPIIVVATKIDKLKRSQRNKQLEQVAETLSLRDGDELLPFSSQTKEGKEKLWQAIFAYMD